MGKHRNNEVVSKLTWTLLMAFAIILFLSIFTTVISAEDTTGPQVVSTSPKKGDRDVSVDTVVIVVFSEPMDTMETDSATKFGYPDSMVFHHIAFSREWSTDDTTVTLTPKHPLDEASKYTLEILGWARDKAGNMIDPPIGMSFSTPGYKGDESPFGSSAIIILALVIPAVVTSVRRNR